MKKFLLSLAVLFAGMASAQKYYQVASEVEGTFETDTPYLLSCDVAGTRFLTDNDVTYLTEEIPTDAALVEFEEAETDDETGVTFYRIKFSDSGMYLADQEMWHGWDSSDMQQDGVDPWDPAPYIFKTADPTEAALWSVLPAETRTRAAQGAEDYVANWRVWTGQGTGEGDAAIPFPGSWVIMRKGLSTPPDSGDGVENAVYLEVQSDYIMYALWGANAWFIGEPEEMDDDALLEAWVESNLPDGVDYLTSAEVNAVGNRIGQYTQASFEVLQAAFAAYETYIDEEEGDPAQILAGLMAALEGLAINEMQEGYYYLLAKRVNSGVIDDKGVMRAQENFEVPTKEDGSVDLTVQSSKYLWYFEAVPETETYLIKNFGTGSYVKTSAHNDNTGIKTGAREDAVAYNVEYSTSYYGTVLFKHYNAAGTRDCSWNYFWNNGKVIGNWYPEDDGNSFYLYNVDEALVDAIADEVEQNALNEKLAALYGDAASKYNAGRAFKPAETCTLDDNFADHGLISYEKDAEGNPVLDENGQVVSNLTVVDANGNPAIHTGDGQGTVVGLLDGDKATFTHTVWSGTTYPHNFDIDLGEALDGISLKMMRRYGTTDHNASFGFGEAKIFVRNSVEEDWVQVNTLPVTYNIDMVTRNENGEVSVDSTGAPVVDKADFVGVGACGFGDSYRYVRIQHWKTLPSTASGTQQNTYFSAAEMAVFAAVYDAENSMLAVIPTEVVDALVAEMAKAKAELAEGKATQAQIDALKAAYNEFVENYPDPTRLTDALTAAKQISTNIPTGSEPSYYPEAAKAAFEAVVAEVEATVAPVMTLAAINEGIEKLAAAKAALLKSLNMPANGFYQIRIDAANYAEAVLYAATEAVDTDEKNGLLARFSKLVQHVAGTDTSFVDNANFTESVSSIWYLEQGADNKVAVRSLSNGLYLQSNLRRGNNIQLAPEKVYLDLQADGLIHGDAYNFIVGTDSVSGNTLYCNINSTTASNTGELVSWDSASGQDNSTFRFDEVNLAEYAYGKNNFVMAANATKFMTFAYDCKYLFQTAKIYEALGFYEGEDGNYVYFQQLKPGSDIVAGQGYLVKAGEDNEVLTLQFEAKEVTADMFNYSYEAKSKNGLTGTIFTTEVGAKYGVIGFGGMITSTANTTTAEGEEKLATVAPLSGYIDGNTLPVLTTAPEGADITRIATKLDINHLNAIEGVETVETAKAGVYTISGVRLNSAKNLPAGIYIINGKKVIK